jgi:hypothetical protein
VTYQSDYILRMIEELARAVATLRNRLLGRGPDRDPLVGEVREIAARADIDLDVARTVDLDTLRLLTSPGGVLDRGRCWLTAELLAVEALAAGPAGAGDASRRRALAMYRWLPETWRPVADQPSVAERIAELEAAGAER